MPRKSIYQIVAELLAKHEPQMQNAFLQAIQEITNNITLRVIVERLERGDITGAIEAMQIEPDAFARLEQALYNAYADGGQAETGSLPLVRDPDGNRIVFRFDLRNPQAEEWIQRHSSTLVTRIVDDQRNAIRTALTEGLSQGQNPRQTALAVVGRVERSSNRRTGGIIGLTAPQERFVSSARQELLAGDKNYFTRERRDRRFDRTIRKAFREGVILDNAMINRIVGRYADRLLILRGELLAQNETQTAISMARDHAIRQQIAAGKIDAEAVEVVWKHTPQEHPRWHHRMMNGKTVPIDEQFVLPNGARMSHPHSEDAPIGETAFCKCLHSYRINYFAAVEHRFKAA